MNQKIINSLKIILFIFAIMIVNVSCKNKKTTKETSKTELTTASYSKEIVDFGELNEGEKVIHTFTIKNTGETPLIISRINNGCTCTKVMYDKKPVKSGEELKMDIEFDSSTRYGKQYKNIYIYANVRGGVIKLRFTSNVSQ